jgi:hypothetical protein
MRARVERSSKIENDYPLRSLKDARELRRTLIDAGYSPTIASGVVGWIIEKSHSGVSDVAPASQTRYRSILAGLRGGTRARRHAG